jgi:hypothetical protein
MRRKHLYGVQGRVREQLPVVRAPALDAPILGSALRRLRDSVANGGDLGAGVVTIAQDVEVGYSPQPDKADADSGHGGPPWEEKPAAETIIAPGAGEGL